MPSPSRVGRRLSLTVLAMPLLLAAGLAARLASPAAEPPQSKDAPPAKAVRTPWTTSRVVGSPDPPPPFKVVRAFPNLKFDHPLLVTRFPDSDRLVVGEQAGVIYSFADRPDATADLSCDLPRAIKTRDPPPDAT